MSMVLGLMAGLVLVMPVLALVFSFRLTSRPAPDEAMSPADRQLSYEEVSFPARDGVQLRGWLIPAGGLPKAIIFLHGHNGSMDPDLEYVSGLHESGFTILMFDFRGHGRSEGEMVTLGCLEKYDALGAVDFLKERGVQRIGLLGFSMGAFSAILTAATCQDIRAVVSDGGFPRATSPIAGWARQRGIPEIIGRPFAWLIVLMTSLRLGHNLFRYQPLHWVGKISPRPILFIHGGRDPYVSERDFNALIAAAGEPKEVWIDPQAGHRELHRRNPEGYQKRLRTFFQRHL